MGEEQTSPTVITEVPCLLKEKSKAAMKTTREQ